MTPENPNLELIDDLLKRFATTLSKPQLAHFKQILKGILFSSKKSIRVYGQSSMKDQSSLNRFMHSKAVDEDGMHQILKDIIRELLEDSSSKDFIVDDTHAHHPFAKQIFGIGRHYDHLEGDFTLGHSLVTAGIKQHDTFYPTNYALYRNHSDVSEASEFKTKIEIGLDYIKEWIEYVDNVLIDSWYAEKTILKYILAHKKHFYTMLKKDRNFTVKGRKRQLKEWKKYLDPREFRIVHVNEKFYSVYEQIGTLPKVGKVKILFVSFYDPETKQNQKLHYLCTSDLTKSAEEILSKYEDRWAIEVFHRDIKQNIGLEQSIFRKETGVRRHFLMSYIAHTMLVLLKEDRKSCGEIQQDLKSMYLENVLRDYGLPDHNLEECKMKLMVLC